MIYPVGEGCSPVDFVTRSHQGYEGECSIASVSYNAEYGAHSVNSEAKLLTGRPTQRPEFGSTRGSKAHPSVVQSASQRPRIKTEPLRLSERFPVKPHFAESCNSCIAHWRRRRASGFLAVIRLTHNRRRQRLLTSH